MHVLIWGARTAPSSRDGRDAQGKLKQNVIFSPQRPPNQPEYTYPARKYLSSQKILIQPENTCPSSALATGLAQSSLAKPSHGSTNTWKYLEPALPWSCISNHSPTRRETRPTDGNSGLIHSVPRFPRLQTSANCSVLLWEEHRDLLGRDQAPTSGGCGGCWARQPFRGGSDTSTGHDL